MLCEVYLLDVPYHLDRAFDYIAADGVCPGSIVRVPFGRANNLRYGVVTALKEDGGASVTEGVNIKPVHSVVSERFALNEEMLGLCLFMKEHTLCTLGEAVRTVLPPGALSDSLNIKFRKICTLNMSREAALTLLMQTGRAGVRSEGQRAVIRYLMEVGTADAELVRAQPGVTPAHVAALKEKGIITVSEEESIRNP